MTINKLNGYALKIYLDKDDLEKFGMSYSDINVRSIRNILLEISDEISYQLNIDLDKEKLYVEVFSQKNGCLIFVSYSPEKRRYKIVKKNIICQFNDFNSLKIFCNLISVLYPNSIEESILYCGDSFIRMILKLKSNYESIYEFSMDHADVITGDEINLGATEEYFKMIISENAIEQVLSYISK